jgi:uroporphyrinogen-III decarboxylase
MAAIRHRIPDRVPVDLHNFLMTVTYAGYRMSDALRDGELLAEAQLKFWRDFGHDVLLKEAGSHGTSTGEAGVDFIGPRLYRKFAHPYDCRLIAAVGSPDFPVALHICGDSTLILPEMIATGAQILELDYKTDMCRAKALMTGRTTFLGPVNPELIWAAKSPTEVEDAAREALEILTPGGEFILGPGCALGANTPAQNIHALIEAAAKYGIYKPDGSLRKVV